MRRNGSTSRSRPQPVRRHSLKFSADSLEEQKIPVAPQDVFERYAEIFQAAARLQPLTGTAGVARERLLIVANDHLPTVQVCLERPLRALVQAGTVTTSLLTETRLKRELGRRGSDEAVGSWVEAMLDRLAPTAIIFSRYSGPFSSDLTGWAKRNRVPVIYHIDDDLLGVPKSLGEAKHAYHNAPERLEVVRSLLASADLVYASTEALRQRLAGYLAGIRAIAGSINASGEVMRQPAARPAKIIGYMASADHLANLEMVLPAIIAVLKRHPELEFELFGSIPVPDSLNRFGDRVRSTGPVADYGTFLARLKEREWDIGICPLVPTDFNRTKSNNKWIEYTAVGAAVVASRDMIYDESCADGCGILADTVEEWERALELLATDAEGRCAMVERAQTKLTTRYGIAQHRRQILDVIGLARGYARQEDFEGKA